MKRLPRLSKPGILTPSEWNGVAKVIEDNFREVTLQPGVGYTLNSSPGGQSLKIAGGSSSAPPAKLPFDMILSVSGGNDQVSLVPGICGGFLPTNLNTSVTIDLSSTVYVFLDVVASQGQITSVTINANNTPFAGQAPTAGYPPDSFVVPVGLITVDTNGNSTATYNLLAKNWISPVGSVIFSVGLTNYYVWTW